MRLSANGIGSCLRSYSLMTGVISFWAKSRTIFWVITCSGDREKSIHSSVKIFSIIPLGLLKQKARRSWSLRRATGWDHPSFLLDPHVAKLVRVVLGEQQVHARQDKQQK